MGTTRVTGQFADAWKPETKGDSIKGKYLGVQKVEGNRGDFNSYHFKGEPTKEDPEGARFSASGAALNACMDQIPRGTLVTIHFLGTETTKRGQMRLYEVDVPEGTRLIDPFEPARD